MAKKQKILEKIDLKTLNDKDIMASIEEKMAETDHLLFNSIKVKKIINKFEENIENLPDNWTAFSFLELKGWFYKEYYFFRKNKYWNFEQPDQQNYGIVKQTNTGSEWNDYPDVFREKTAEILNDLIEKLKNGSLKSSFFELIWYEIKTFFKNKFGSKKQK